MFELSVYFSKFYNIKIFHLLNLLKILGQLYEKEAILTTTSIPGLGDLMWRMRRRKGGRVAGRKRESER